MIVKNELEQWAGCTVCGEQVELRRKTMADPETMLLILEHLEREHQGCETYKHNPRQARLHREFSARVREELAKIERASL